MIQQCAIAKRIAARVLVLCVAGAARIAISAACPRIMIPNHNDPRMIAQSQPAGWSMKKRMSWSARTGLPDRWSRIWVNAANRGVSRTTAMTVYSPLVRNN